MSDKPTLPPDLTGKIQTLVSANKGFDNHDIWEILLELSQRQDHLQDQLNQKKDAPLLFD